MNTCHGDSRFGINLGPYGRGGGGDTGIGVFIILLWCLCVVLFFFYFLIRCDKESESSKARSGQSTLEGHSPGSLRLPIVAPAV